MTTYECLKCGGIELDIISYPKSKICSICGTDMVAVK